MTLPNQLTLLRMACAPVLLIHGWLGQHTLFLIVLAFAFCLDAIDGPIARRLHQESKFGSKIDSMADFFIYISFALGAWWLWPDIIRRELAFVILILVSITFPVIMGLIKFGKLTSYHTWLVKFAAVCTAVSGLLLFVFDIALPFRIASTICGVAAIEELLITRVLKEPISDARTLWHVINKTRA